MSTVPPLAGPLGAAASTHWLATATAMSVLGRGGNAFDAATAAGFVLQVVQPHQNGPGGEAPAVFWSVREQRVRVLNGQGVAPAAASIEVFADLGLSEVPGTGLLAATVPGAVGGWLLLLEHYGTWRLRDTLDYAIGYAQRGFVASDPLLEAIDGVAELFDTSWPTSRALWRPEAERARGGGLMRNRELAHTYQGLVAEAERTSADRDGQIQAAREIWYTGPVAETIDRFSSATRWTDTSGEAHGGLLRAADMAGWQPDFEEPVTIDYAGYTVAKTGPWGQGPVFGQQLRLLERLGLPALPRDSADYAHTVIEAAKLAFADREAWYGDGGDGDVLAELLSTSYAARRAGLVVSRADLELRPGDPLGRAPRMAVYTADPAAVAAGSGDPTRGAPGVSGRVRRDTCQLDVADRFGNIISATPSGGWLPSSPAIPGLGFCLGTRAQMFAMQPGLPNSLLPGRRPRTTLSPGLVLDDGEPWLAFGTPGGDQQDQWTLQFFLDLVRAGRTHGAGGELRAALDRPRFHSEHFPSSFYPRQALLGRVVVENNIGPEVIAELTGRGHDVVTASAWTLGRICAVTRRGNLLAAAADLRGGEAYASAA